MQVQIVLFALQHCKIEAGTEWIFATIGLMSQFNPNFRTYEHRQCGNNIEWITMNIWETLLEEV